MKYSELNNINLQGWECYERTLTERGYLYSLQKKNGGVWDCMNSLFSNIEYQIEFNLTDVGSLQPLRVA